MKSVSSILFLLISLIFFICLSPISFSAEGNEKVLLIIKELHGSADLQFMEAKEAVLMKQIFEAEGFQVVIASATKRTFLWEKTALESEIQLADANITDYAGFMITCSGLGSNTPPGSKLPLAFGETYLKPEEVKIAKRIAAEGKPVAAQHRGVIILAQAGVLEGKKYSYDRDLLISGATYGGKGVIQDGNVITSTYCPHYADYYKQNPDYANSLGQEREDQTIQLTKTLIGLLQE